MLTISILGPLLLKALGRPQEMFNPLVLKSSSKIVVWIDDTFDHNFSIENDFTKYLKESCW